MPGAPEDTISCSAGYSSAVTASRGITAIAATPEFGFEDQVPREPSCRGHTDVEDVGMEPIQFAGVGMAVDRTLRPLRRPRPLAKRRAGVVDHEFDVADHAGAGQSQHGCGPSRVLSL